MLEARDLWNSAPPEPRSRMANWPTVLFSWWCTSFAAVIIITRLLGRKVRSNTLFREDYIMMIALIPLFIRMIIVHFVLIYGTNNIDTANTTLTEAQLHHHSVGARLVLAARIFYAMFIWLSKLTVCEFLKRITIRVWRKSWEITLRCIRAFLFLSFGAVVIATLTECQPFDHYWQVVPDPGPHCRQGYAQLLTMGTCDIVTDLMLIAFPIPIVLKSGQSWKRKVQMMALFSLSIIMIAVTATRMPEVIMHHGRQQYRTVWASCEILASAAVSNTVIIGSFLRDKGTKKNKYRNTSVTDSLDRSSARRPTLATLQTTDSDEDLFRSLGVRMPEHLQGGSLSSPRPAPPALPASSPSPSSDTSQAKSAPLEHGNGERHSDSDGSLERPIIKRVVSPRRPSANVSTHFLDAGNLLEHNGPKKSGGVAAQDFAASPSNTAHNSPSGPREFLKDFSGRLGGVRSYGFRRSESGTRDPRRDQEQSPDHAGTNSPNPSSGILGPMLERHETQMSLQDAGGLLQPVTLEPNPTSSFALTRDRSAPIDVDMRDDRVELHAIDDVGTRDRREARGRLSLREILSRELNPEALQAKSRDQGPSDDLVLHDPGGLMGR